MIRPRLRAEVMIVDEEHTQILVQCDENESFYRFPGGSIKFGETAEEAIMRELLEEYDVEVFVQQLAVVNEHIFTWNNEKGHHCTLMHWGATREVVTNAIKHKEHEDLSLIHI